MAVKKLIGKLHLLLGFVSGLVVFIVALTGVILVFEVEVYEFVNQKLFFIEPQAQSRLSIDELMTKVQAAYPGRAIEGFELDEGANRSIRFSLSDDEGRNIVFVHPCTGSILGAVEYEKRFFTIVLKLHRYLLAGDTGKTITGISAIIFIILLITGIVLGFPRNMALLRQRLSVKWEARWRRVNYDLHSTLGFYAYIVLFLMAATGLVWSYKAVNNAIFILADGKPQEKKYFSGLHAEKNLLYENIIIQTNNLYNFAGNMSVRFPKNDSLAITVYKENLEAAIPNVSSAVFFDQYSGKLIEAAPYETASLGMKIRRVVYPLHTGSLFGLPTQILAMVVSLFAASFPVTGILIWWGRRNKVKKVKHPSSGKGKPGVKVNLPEEAGR